MAPRRTVFPCRILRSRTGWSLALALIAAPLASTAPSAPGLELHEPGLEVRLVAADPDLVAPVGIAIGPDDRIHVIESRTHLRTGGAGSDSDRIRVFVDSDGDGRVDGNGVFADGFQAAMNLLFLPDGDLLVVCAREVWRLGDDDRDGRADRRVRLLEWITPNTHPHNALLGVALGPDGWLHVSRGHNDGLPWRLRDAGGAELAGEGDGGAVVRCRPDGTGLKPFATGFRNPFAVIVDAAGRVVVADNDPDARGPNRLLHGVEGGDYGFRSRYGGAGTHPFQGWDGDRPGSLPMAAALDEAPAGLLDTRSTALAYAGLDSLLVTSWAAHRVDRLLVEPAGVSFTATRRPLLTGGADFHPVALAADSRGTVYLTDWVVGEYPSHDRGRLWAVRGGTPVGTDASARRRDRDAARAARETGRIGRIGPWGGWRLRAALVDPDPFRAQAAVRALSRPPHARLRERFGSDPDPRVRIAALLAAERSGGGTETDFLRRALADPDPEMRRTALILAGERRDPALREELDRALDVGTPTVRLFVTHRAAAEALDPGDGTAPPREAAWLERFIADRDRPAGLRAVALTRLVSPRPADHRPLLVAALDDPDIEVVLAAVEALAEASGPDADAALRRMALDRSRPARVRAGALVSLGGRHDPGVEELLPLLEDPEPEVAYESARLLRSHVAHAEHPSVRETFVRLADAGRGVGRSDVVRMALGRLDPPDSGEAWNRVLNVEKGRPERGRRVFFSAQAACARCHRVGEHGREVGPELTWAARSLSRERLIRAVLEPSAESAPEYLAWYVETRDGPVHQGLRLQELPDGSVSLWTPDSGQMRFEADEVADMGPLAQSLMPEGLAGALSPGEMRDLIAYLESLR